MKGSESQRQIVLDLIADYLLANGLHGASLRPLAAAAGTSDRMLLYYFANKEELMAAALTRIAERLMKMLDGPRAKPMPFHKLLPHLAQVMTEPAILPYMKLWIELVAFAGRGDETYKAIGAQVCEGFITWIAAALKVNNEAERIPQAALLLATVDGLSLIDAIGSHTTSTAALKGISLLYRPAK